MGVLTASRGLHSGASFAHVNAGVGLWYSSPELTPLDSPASPASHDRLDGWKEISAHIGRGIRTAQRWERDLGMPVHRLSTGAGEAVYARRPELDAWIVRQSRSSLAPMAGDGDTPDGNNGSHHAASTPTATPVVTHAAPSRPRGTSWRRAGLGMSLVLVLVMVAAWLGFGPAPEPASVEFSGKTMTGYDAKRARLWDVPFDVPLQEFPPNVDVGHAVAIGDIDRDGRNDVVIARQDPADARVYAWNHKGEQRFAHTFDRLVRFGDYACPPVYPTHVMIETRPPFAGTLWAWGQHPMWFPAVLQRLDAGGNVQSEYWSNGYIGAVRSLVLAGRPMTLIGAANNDLLGASLAVFFGDPNGSAPSAAPKYRCEGCPPGVPDVFLVFPRSRLQAAINVNSMIPAVDLVGHDRLVVQVEVAGSMADVHRRVVAYYTLDAELRVTAVELGSSADAVHRKYEAEHLTTAATRFQDTDLFPVLRWNGTGWDTIPGPETATGSKPESTKPPSG